MADIPIAELRAKLRLARPAAEIPLADLRTGLDAATARLRTDPAIRVRAQNAAAPSGEWLWAPQTKEQGSILYLHGGGFVAGSAQTHRALAAAIALASGARVFSANYRLAPEHPWPAAEHDSFSVLEWFRRTCAGQRLAVVADSAGGYLAISALLRTKALGMSLPAAVVLLSPWLDIDLTGGSMRDNANADPTLSRERLARYASWYLAGQPAPDLLSADMRGLPRTLIQVGSDEVLRSDSERLAAALSAAGVEVRLEVWPGMFHVWHSYAAWLPEARAAIRQVGGFLKSQLAAHR